MPTSEAAKIAKDILDGLAGLTGEPDEIVCQASLLEQDIAEALDRFAAQRGAEVEAENKMLRDTMDCLEWLKEKHDAAPSQTGGGDAPRRHLTRDEVRIMDKALLASSTLIHAGELAGGGDAGERARAIMRRLRDMGGVFADPVNDRQDCLDDLTLAIEDAETDVTAALRSSHREAMEAPFTKALVAEARTQGYREGAEAMREAADQVITATRFERGHVDVREIRARVRALPIPGNKT